MGRVGVGGVSGIGLLWGSVAAREGVVGVSAGMSWWGMGVGDLVGWVVFYVGLSVFRWVCWGEPVMGGACYTRGEKRGRLG